jgi:predicted membrane channel-forming protein YqfA (hemolysin III family)
MKDIPKTKYEILDLIFTVLIATSLLVTAIFLLSNLLVSIIYIVIVALFTVMVFIFWRIRNPFNLYSIRTLAFSNLIVTFIALVIYFSDLSPSPTNYPGFILLLGPSGVYLIISFRFSAVTTPSDKKEGAMLALAGLPKAAQRRMFRDNPEEREQREELLAKQKKTHKYNLIIGFCIVLVVCSLLALIFGFY